MGKCYRVYANFEGWKLLSIVQTPKQAYDLIQSVYYESTMFIVIEHDPVLNCDTPYKSIHREQNLIDFKNEIIEQEKNKKLKK